MRVTEVSAKGPDRRLFAQMSTRAGLLTVVMTTGALVMVALGVDMPIKVTDLLMFAALVVLGVLAAESSRHVERARRRISDTPHMNFSSVWTLAGALLLPPVLCAGVVIVLYGHLWWRSWRRLADVDGTRIVFATMNVVATCEFARWLASQLHPSPYGEYGIRGTIIIGLVVLAYFTVNFLLVSVYIVVTRPGISVRKLVGPLNENVIELATLCLGVLTAVTLTKMPALVIFLYLPLHALHRNALIRQLEYAITKDAKTGLLNAAAWHGMAENELAKPTSAGKDTGLLLIDVDHLRRVNEAFGHRIGDEALRRCGAALRQVLHDDALAGRLGGEEFVVLVPRATRERLMNTADRIREAVAEIDMSDALSSMRSKPANIPLSVTVGAALSPGAGNDLAALLQAADNALFAAKDSGSVQIKIR